MTPDELVRDLRKVGNWRLPILTHTCAVANAAADTITALSREPRRDDGDTASLRAEIAALKAEKNRCLDAIANLKAELYGEPEMPPRRFV